jgi:hypothetical protein
MTTMNPALDLGLEGGNIGLQIVGWILEKQARDQAIADAKALDYRNFEYGKTRDKQSDKQFNEQLKLQKQQVANQTRTTDTNIMLSKYGITQDNITRVGQILNTNTALQNNVVSNWGRR